MDERVREQKGGGGGVSSINDPSDAAASPALTCLTKFSVQGLEKCFSHKGMTQ